ncbi:hypothetical protein DYE50_08990 [Treponema ruminis]|uniref:Flagellar hook-length control protein FliK n=1 Tax=Treponema ruminis TaxID=744515 RepID=A0A7W8G9Q4_9SPIR|nr:flagellar hook-length control protein FliK [Treponema ruminis]MBB5226392.1 flagellar hook-length control protein FliK [Treponema ruminis]QSI02703.1 hypothetical protein DYE50_08990 [Treponema ruminis]
MNILSISQVQTQASQADFAQELSQSQRTSSSEKASFADLLRDARKADSASESVKSEKTEEKAAVESEKIARNDENADSSKISDKNEEKVSEKNEKSEKLTQRKSSDEEKSEENLKNLAKTNEDGQILSAHGMNLSENYRIRTISAKNENEASIESLEGLAENPEIDDKMLAWLVASSKDAENEDISNEDFSALIDAAVEFIPGEESEEEKLEIAQNLAVSDPKLFLEAVENAEPVARGAVKSELALDDRKIASNEKKSDSKISVHDLRTHHLLDESESKIASDKIVQKAAEKKEINLSMQKQADGNIQMTMELAAKAEQNITSSSAQTAGASGSNFQAMLSNAVQENAPDFVKAGNIVLKDNNQGSINLILRPEGLGNVKISLNLDDKNLSAQIMVNTKEAMEAFKESLPSLKQAFTESGFETGSFDLNFSNNQSNQQGFAQGENQNKQLFAQKSYGEFVTPRSLASEAAADSYVDNAYGINIVA